LSGNIVNVMKVAATSKGARKRKAQRPLRGLPEQTRERLVAAAAELFNRCGYHGTNSNQIAHEAGYATGTFYKHFKDKREVFLAAYERWATSEWETIQIELAAGGTIGQIARRLVDLAVEYHTKWRGLRAALLELVRVDPQVRRFYQAERRNQIELMRKLRAARGGRTRTREDDAIHLYVCERTYDAIAWGEPEVLGLDRDKIVSAMVRGVIEVLGGNPTDTSRLNK
jgi:AcrR family transcriptional regulator